MCAWLQNPPISAIILKYIDLSAYNSPKFVEFTAIIVDFEVVGSALGAVSSRTGFIVDIMVDQRGMLTIEFVQANLLVLGRQRVLHPLYLVVEIDYLLFGVVLPTIAYFDRRKALHLEVYQFVD